MYNEDVWAAYINGSGSMGAFMVQAGLRLEHTESEGESLTLENFYEQNIFLHSETD